MISSKAVVVQGGIAVLIGAMVAGSVGVVVALVVIAVVVVANVGRAISGAFR